MSERDEFSDPWPKDAVAAYRSNRDGSVHDTIEALRAHHAALDHHAAPSAAAQIPAHMPKTERVGAQEA